MNACASSTPLGLRMITPRRTSASWSQLSRALRGSSGSRGLRWRLIARHSAVAQAPAAALGGTGHTKVWPRWREGFDLPFRDYATGYGQSPEEVGAVRVNGVRLAGYHADVHEATQRYLEGLTPAELARVVDPNWDPPVTAAVRLVSVIGDALQHLGQAGYVRGLAERSRGQSAH